MRLRSPRLLVLLIALLAPLVASAQPAPAAEPGELRLTLTAEAGGPALAWQAPTANPDGSHLRLEVGTPAVVPWSTAELDPAAYRSDLVHLELVSVDGPGALEVRTDAPDGRDVPVLSSPGQAETVWQLAREGEQRWSVDTPGRYRVELRASTPLATGGSTTTATTLVIDATGDPLPGAPAPTVPPAPSERAEGPAAPTGGVPEVAAAPLAEDAPSPAAGDAPGPGGDAQPMASAGGVVIADGHVDIGPRLLDGCWAIQVRDDTSAPPVWRNPGDVALQVTDSALVEVPDQPGYAFLGAPGTPYHLLPQAQTSGIVWPGWNTQDASVVGGVTGSVSWRLLGVDGPGRFVLFGTGSFGETQVWFDSDAGLPQVLDVPLNTHAHGNWGFSQPGTYQLRIEMSATLTDGTPVSATSSIGFAIGDGTDPSRAFGSTGDGCGPGGDGGAPGGGTGGSGGSDSVGITTATPGARGAGSGGSGGSGAGQLVRTGAEIAPAVALGAALIATGAVLVRAVRRRRTSTP